MCHHDGDHNQSAVHSASSFRLSVDDEHMKDGTKESFHEDANAKEGVVS